MSADPDGDSEMVSSPESEDLHQPSSPQPTGTRTPTNGGTHFNSELSPPGSQKASEPAARPGGMTFTTGSEAVDRKGDSKTTEKPGASWMNKRAEEEYQRALENVVDRDFSLREFGDPFDERDVNTNGF
ncbi:hypothetical protein DTO166G4_7325 [Paecilomyces variotii]|uniref:Uncharacterized protein n=1 Tax=Byssochlamys spectabilis TaxID=264951 RepID=A0A443HRU8_BYSSP|nr:hypothetical protein C8Q69DRAFT_294800 [Paecilomyces variotii]KAJ9198994.1 hypothetical protein DTO032I3_5226 [Paecilomyces variotii]KAJ9211034.1 hypothetical protein DTO166G4_7325 [Paecilomyces variotii]KAJ9225413.1 hypothetical protein DTO169C6_2146 [Paecilomyces variotii]KAJ9227809.1 hypothetical protein DTO166G5_9129 [Paecilomyces variotii]KAJ9251271.1 hypothetical protein DTO195F2_7906 [Paecilomyces variotii]